MDKRFGIALVAAVAASCSAADAPAIAHVGRPAPQWTDPLSTGGSLSSATLAGKATYLNFFATWCPPCNQEAPYIDELARKYAARGLAVVGVDVLENAKKAEQFRAEHRLSYPAVVDGGTLRGLYRVNGLPVHVFIGRDGVVKAIRVGEMSKPEIEAAIQSVLKAGG